MSTAMLLTRALNGTWHGHYGSAFCPAHTNTRTPALSLTDGRNGRLLVWCHAGCEFAAVVNSLRRIGLMDGRHVTFPQNAEERLRIHKADADKRERQAMALWCEALPAQGTPAEMYLRGRGITCELPATVRFHPRCWHGPSASRLPAMIVLVEGSDGFAIHRTYIRCDGRAKATVDPQKMMLGITAGGAARLMAAGDQLVVAEGIETALSLGSGILRGPATIWAALSASGIASLCLPSQPGRLTIATDGDSVGRAAGLKLAERATAAGWRVALLPAPEGKDWNDLLASEKPAT